jgi:hypothetical protein
MEFKTVYEHREFALANPIPLVEFPAPVLPAQTLYTFESGFNFHPVKGVTSGASGSMFGGKFYKIHGAYLGRRKNTDCEYRIVFGLNLFPVAFFCGGYHASAVTMRMDLHNEWYSGRSDYENWPRVEAFLGEDWYEKVMSAYYGRGGAVLTDVTERAMQACSDNLAFTRFLSTSVAYNLFATMSAHNKGSTTLWDRAGGLTGAFSKSVEHLAGRKFAYMNSPYWSIPDVTNYFSMPAIGKKPVASYSSFNSTFGVAPPEIESKVGVNSLQRIERMDQYHNPNSGSMIDQITLIMPPAKTMFYKDMTKLSGSPSFVADSFAGIVNVGSSEYIDYLLSEEFRHKWLARFTQGYFPPQH